MRDENREVLYVGKAKNLKNRVSTYFGAGDGRDHIFFLMERVADLETVICASEQQALVLEWDLIRKYKPKYNIRLKDDKAYYSVRIDENANWPRVQLVRRIENDGATYFGPFPPGNDLRNVVEIINKVIPLRTCTDTVFYNRVRPCLEYQIKRCCGPCCLTVDKQDYREWVKQAKKILNGNVKELIEEFSKKMQVAAEMLNFEEAAIIRDRIEALKSFVELQSGIIKYGESQDIFNLFREGGRVALAVLKVKSGRIVDGSYHLFTECLETDQEIIESAIEQFYRNSGDVPIEIILPFELDNQEIFENLFKDRFNLKPVFTVPKIGAKKNLLSLARLNAEQHFISKFDEETRYTSAVTKLSEILKLKQIPRRIECVDISNLQGSDIVGAVVVFYDGKPLKSEYKKYIIKQQGKPDDFYSIYEVVTRRLTLAMQTGEFPDLFLIDGGPNQLAFACKARDDLNITTRQEIASIAKIRENAQQDLMPERLYRENDPEPTPLNPDDEVTKLVTKIRDEVHRFVITFHRQRRSKRVVSSALDNIVGLGEIGKKRLLKEFGSVGKIRLASVQELSVKAKISLVVAKKILEIIQK